MRRDVAGICVILNVLIHSIDCLASVTDGDRQATDTSMISSAATAYRLQHGHYPESDEASTWFEKLVAAEFLAIDQLAFGTTPNNALPIDTFGQPVVYTITNQGAQDAVVVRSIGRNGINEYGNGDDFDSRYGANIGHWNKSAWPAAFTFVSASWLGAAVAGILIWIITRRRLATFVVTLSFGGVFVGIVGAFHFDFGIAIASTSLSRFPAWLHIASLISLLGLIAFVCIGVVILICSVWTTTRIGIQRHR